jgi:hypothetical protein
VRYALLGAAFLVGFIFRDRLERRYRLIYRGQALLIGAPLGFIAGWTFETRASSLLTLLALLPTELAVIAFAVRLATVDRISPVHAVSATSNSGFWAIPIAGTLFGPNGAAFAIVYDIIGVLRPLLILRILRKSAPEPPSRTSALADYAPDAALLIGLVLGVLTQPPELARDVLSIMAIGLGLIGFALLGAAMPDHPPRTPDFVAALPVIPLRFLAPVTTCLILRAGRGGRAGWSVGHCSCPSRVPHCCSCSTLRLRTCRSYSHPPHRRTDCSRTRPRCRAPREIRAVWESLGEAVADAS